jgi:cytoskeletal protein CcmA (bactofilin family)
MNIIKILQIPSIKKAFFLLVLLLLAMLLAIFPVWSSISANGENLYLAGDNVIIKPSEVIKDDVYLTGDRITIDGTVKGDAVLAGREITINGTVEGDLIAAGQAVVINGTVRDDIRIVGQVLILDSQARVGDDVMAAGASLENKAESTVGGNLHFYGAQALLAGRVGGNAIGAMNSLDIRGTVGKDMEVIALGDPNPLQAPFIPKTPVPIPQVEPGLTVADSAQINGKLTYKSLAAGNISQKAQVTGGVTRVELPPDAAHRYDTAWGQIPTQHHFGWFLLNRLQRLLALVLVGWLLMRFLPSFIPSLAVTVQTRTLPTLGWGIISFLAVWVMMIAIAIISSIMILIFAFTLPHLILPVIGLGILANLTLLISLLIFASYVPQIILSFLGGRWLLHKIRPDQPLGSYLSLIVGLVAFTILTSLPVLGNIISLIIFFLGLGAFCWWWIKRDRATVKQFQMV